MENSVDLKINQNIQLVSFNLAEEEFGIYIENIQEIIKVPNITNVPLTEAFVEGVINIRGNIIPVVNLKMRTSFETGKITPDSRVIIINIKNRRVGFLVDNVNEVIRTTEDNIHLPPEESIDEDSNKYISGVYSLKDRLVTILDVENLLKEY